MCVLKKIYRAASLRHLLIFLYFYFLGCNNLFSQISITSAPEDLQLFARDHNNTAEVVVSGNIQESDITNLSLIVYEENKLFSYQNSDIDFSTSKSTNFHFSTKIYARPTSFDFKLFSHKRNGDSVEVLNRSNIVCGDFFLLYGQSNMVALAGIDDFQKNIDDRLMRNANFTKEGKLKWYNAREPYGAVGTIGLTLQRLILEKYGIPTCFLNGSQGGAGITTLINPDTSFSTTNSPYANLYLRAKAAGALNKIKAIIWRQGENETCTWQPDIDGYPSHFSTLYQQLNKDFGSILKFYNIQTDIQVCDHPLEGGGQLRDFMRRTKYLYENIETLSSFDLPFSDHVHYTSESYIKTAQELFPLISRDLYGSKDTNEIHPPDIQEISAYFGGDTLTLTFENDQKINFPEPFTVNGKYWKLEDYFYLNSTTAHNNFDIEKGWAQGNKVFLKLKNKFWGGWLTYLPSYVETTPPIFPIHLKNSRGLRAFSFYQVPITVKFIDPEIVNFLIENNTITLQFKESDNYIVELAVGDEPFMPIDKVIAKNYFEMPLPKENTQTLKFRIKRSYLPYESAYSNIVRIENNHTEMQAKLVNFNLFDDEIAQNDFIIRGKNLGENGDVLVGNLKVQINSWADSLISFRLSASYSPNEYQVLVKSNQGRQVQSSTNLIVLGVPKLDPNIQVKLPINYDKSISFLGKYLNDLESAAFLSQENINHKLENILSNDTSLVFNLPKGLIIGTYTLQLKKANRVFNFKNILKFVELPRIEKVSPATVFEKTESVITIEGRFFGEIKGRAYLNKDSAEIIQWTDSKITVRTKKDIFSGKFDIKLQTSDEFEAVLLNGLEVTTILSNEILSGISLFPNPVSGRNIILFSHEKPIKLTAITETGILIQLDFQTYGDNRYLIDLSLLPPGKYLLLVETKKQILTKKLLKLTH